MNTTAIRKGVWAALVTSAIIMSILILVNALFALKFGLDGPRMLRVIMIATFSTFTVGGLVAGYIAAMHDLGGTVLSGALAAGAFQLLQVGLNALFLGTSNFPQIPLAMTLTSVGIAMVVGIVGASIRIFVRNRNPGTTA